MKANSHETQYHLCFETLANELRMRIIEGLKKHPMSVEELAKKVGAERSRVSHSLKILRDCNYVEVKQKGKQRIYSLRKESFKIMQSAVKAKNVFEVLDQHIKCSCNENCKKVKE